MATLFRARKEMIGNEARILTQMAESGHSDGKEHRMRIWGRAR